MDLRSGDATPGQTTEIAILVMYAVGALTVLGSTPVAIVIGGAVAVLPHLREELEVAPRGRRTATYAPSCSSRSSRS